MACASEHEQLALLSGGELVVRLANTCRRADFQAVARILDERDRKFAKDEAALKTVLAKIEAASAREREVAEAKSKLEAALKEADILRRKYEATLAVHGRPLDDAKEMALLLEAAAPDTVHRNELRVEEANGLNMLGRCPAEAEEMQERSKGGGVEHGLERGGARTEMRKAAQEGVTRWRSLRELYGTHVWQGEG
jgi:hypothetical protein